MSLCCVSPYLLPYPYPSTSCYWLASLTLDFSFLIHSAHYCNRLSLFGCPVMSNSLWPHGRQHTRPFCRSPPPGVYPSSCPLHWWCHPAMSWKTWATRTTLYYTFGMSLNKLLGLLMLFTFKVIANSQGYLDLAPINFLLYSFFFFLLSLNFCHICFYLH